MGSPVMEREPRTATAEQAPGQAVQPPTDDKTGSRALNRQLTSTTFDADIIEQIPSKKANSMIDSQAAIDADASIVC